MSFRQIGEALGVSHTQAEKDYAQALADARDLTWELVAQERYVSLARCDWMLERLAPAIDTGDPRAIMAAVRLEQRRAALLGLDAPRQQGTPAPAGTGAVNIIINAAIDQWPDPPKDVTGN